MSKTFKDRPGKSYRNVKYKPIKRRPKEKRFISSKGRKNKINLDDMDNGC